MCSSCEQYSPNVFVLCSGRHRGVWLDLQPGKHSRNFQTLSSTLRLPQEQVCAGLHTLWGSFQRVGWISRLDDSLWTEQKRYNEKKNFIKSPFPHINTTNKETAKYDGATCLKPGIAIWYQLEMFDWFLKIYRRCLPHVVDTHSKFH